MPNVRLFIRTNESLLHCGHGSVHAVTRLASSALVRHRRDDCGSKQPPHQRGHLKLAPSQENWDCKPDISVRPLCTRTQRGNAFKRQKGITCCLFTLTPGESTNAINKVMETVRQRVGCAGYGIAIEMKRKMLFIGTGDPSAVPPVR